MLTLDDVHERINHLSDPWLVQVRDDLIAQNVDMFTINSALNELAAGNTIYVTPMTNDYWHVSIPITPGDE